MWTCLLVSSRDWLGESRREIDREGERVERERER